MKAAVALACLLTMLASGLATGCSLLPSSAPSSRGSALQASDPPMIAPASADRKTQGGRLGQRSRKG